MHKFLPIAALVAFAAPAHAALSDVSAHLKAVRTMTADFTQTAQGSPSGMKGRMILSRPGKVRFQYEQASMLVVADGKALTLIDYKVNQVSRWPIRNTPLAVLLDPEGDLSRYARELGPAEGGVPGMVTVEAKDPKHREYGVTTLYFRHEASAPGGLSLQGWQVLDAQGRTTQVQLSNVKFNVPVDAAAFTFKDPRANARAGPRG